MLNMLFILDNDSKPQEENSAQSIQRDSAEAKENIASEQSQVLVKMFSYV